MEGISRRERKDYCHSTRKQTAKLFLVTSKSATRVKIKISRSSYYDIPYRTKTAEIRENLVISAVIPAEEIGRLRGLSSSSFKGDRKEGRGRVR